MLQSSSRWYHTWWGVVLLSFGFALLLLLVLFVGTTIKYWLELRRGETPAFLNEAPHFTVSGQAKSAPVDRIALETINSPALGRYGAPVTIVEFLDFKCPNCQLAATTLHQIDAAYHDKVRIIVRQFPAESIHPGATQLSVLGYCAHQQNKFWPLYDLLFNEQGSLPNPLDDASIKNLADAAGLKTDAFTACLISGAATNSVTRDYLAGISAGVRGTPTYFVNGEKVEGVVPYSAWQKFLDANSK